MNISILLATCNRPQILTRTLESYCHLQCDGLAFEILVSDNDPEGSARDIVLSFDKRLPIRYIHCEQQGKNFALNKTLGLARGELFVFTDDDTIAEPSWLKEYREGTQRWPLFNIFGGKLLLKNPEIIPEEIKKLSGYRYIYELADWSLKEGPYTAYYVFGGNYAIRKKLLDEGYRFNENVGPSGKNYIMGSETDLLLRLKDKGHEPVYLPGSVVYHQIRPEQITRGWIFQRAYNNGRMIAFNEPATNVPCLFGVPRFLIRQYVEAMLSYILRSLTFNKAAQLEAGNELFNLSGQIKQYRIFAKERNAGLEI